MLRRIRAWRTRRRVARAVTYYTPGIEAITSGKSGDELAQRQTWILSDIAAQLRGDHNREQILAELQRNLEEAKVCSTE